MVEFSYTIRMMEKRGLLIFATCLCLLAVPNATGLKFNRKDQAIYNHTLGVILVEYSAAAYANPAQLFSWTCPRCNGYTRGFKVIKVVVDVQHCLQAFVGVAEDPNAIIIAFRGTKLESITNWVQDISARQIPLNYPGMTDATVHEGFYNAYHKTTIRPAILSALQTAKNSYGDIKIIVTGHSLGGAMASLCGLDLAVNQKAQNVQVVTFGQPRVGNVAFASYYSKLLSNTFRVTNNNDIVPHLPPYYPYNPQIFYHHFPTEVWLHGNSEKVCDQSGEDPTCSNSMSGTGLFDHIRYYGVMIAIELPGPCSGIMDPRVVPYIKRDPKGNYFLSRDPAA